MLAKHLLGTTETAQLLGVSPGRVRQLAASRHLGIKLGRIWIFTRDDIDAMRIRKAGNPRIRGKTKA